MIINNGHGNFKAIPVDNDMYRDDEPETAHDLAQILSPGSIAAVATNPLGGRPPCPRCGRTELRTLRGEALRATWAEEEGVKWSWRRCTKAP